MTSLFLHFFAMRNQEIKEGEIARACFDFTAAGVFSPGGDVATLLRVCRFDQKHRRQRNGCARLRPIRRKPDSH